MYCYCLFSIFRFPSPLCHADLCHWIHCASVLNWTLFKCVWCEVQRQAKLRGRRNCQTHVILFPWKAQKRVWWGVKLRSNDSGHNGGEITFSGWAGRTTGERNRPNSLQPTDRKAHRTSPSFTHCHLIRRRSPSPTVPAGTKQQATQLLISVCVCTCAQPVDVLSSSCNNLLWAYLYR